MMNHSIFSFAKRPVYINNLVYSMEAIFKFGEKLQCECQNLNHGHNREQTDPIKWALAKYVLLRAGPFLRRVY